MTITEARAHATLTEARPRRALATSSTAAPPIQDRLALLAIGARWVTVGLGAIVVVRSGHLLDDVAATLLLAVVAAFVSFRHWQGAAAVDRTHVLAELVVCASAVALSGGLASPYVLAPAIPLMLAGYVLTSRQAAILAYVAVGSTVGLSLLQGPDSETPRSVALVGVVYLLCGLLGVFTRRAVADMDDRHVEAMSQVSRLTQANELLVALHGLAQTMPASLDLADVINDIRNQLVEQFDLTVASLHLRNAATNQWHHEVAYGVRETGVLNGTDLPAVLAAVLDRDTPLLVSEYLNTRAQGVSAFARSGLYCSLRARGQLIGVLAIESDAAHRYDDSDAQRLQTMRNDMALSLDNAVWFGRLRTLGAETERARIARDLHDRIAQSLAYVSFELERLCESDQPAERAHLAQLREVLHEVVTELRDTLYDLRTSISDDNDFATVVQSYLERMQSRHNFAVHYEGTQGARLPTVVEQELWRIVQEGLHNIAKHANADRVNLIYEIDGTIARLELRDNGCGFVPGKSTSDNYGLMGMRERADAIGANLDIASAPGRGTSIRISLEVAA